MRHGGDLGFYGPDPEPRSSRPNFPAIGTASRAEAHACGGGSGPQATTLAAWGSLARRSCTAMIPCRISQMGTSTVGMNDQGAYCIASEPGPGKSCKGDPSDRSEEHTSELQSLRHL